MLAVVHAASPLIPILAIVAMVIIFGSSAIVIALVWDKMPWWRATPKPSRRVKDAKDQVKLWKLQQKYPEAFEETESN